MPGYPRSETLEQRLPISHLLPSCASVNLEREIDCPTLNNNIMAESSNFWTPPLDQDFHRSVAELRSLTEIPAVAQCYRDRAAPESKYHVLSF